MSLLPCPAEKLKEQENAEKDAEEEQDNDAATKHKVQQQQDGEEEIDDETEVLYLQAVEEEANDDDEVEPQAPAEAEQLNLNLNDGLSSGELSRGSGKQKRPSSTAMINQDHGQVRKHPKVAQQTAVSNMPSASTPGVRAPSTPVVALGQLPKPSSPASRAPKSRIGATPKVPSCPPQAPPEQVSRETWNQCVMFSADAFIGTGPGKAMQPPSVYTKETQAAKWHSEVVKLGPFVQTLERVLTSDACKWKDSEIKNAIKAFAKVNSRTDKKLEFEQAKASETEKQLSARVAALKGIFEALRNLKELAIQSGKSGSICEKSLREHIQKVQTYVQQLIPEIYLGFPLHWVQAGLYGQWNFNSNKLQKQKQKTMNQEIICYKLYIYIAAGI